MTHALRTLWILQAPQLRFNLARIAFITGLDVKKPSPGELLSTLYILLFWMVWVLAVLGLAAGEVAGWLVQMGDPATVAADLTAIGLAAWLLVELVQTTRHSPFVFSQTDAQRLCPTPLDRRAVALDRLARRWPLMGLLWAVVATVLAFAVSEAGRTDDMTLLELLPLIASGGRAAALVVPLQLGGQAASWAAGAWRLQGDRAHPRLRWLSWILGGIWLTWAIPAINDDANMGATVATLARVTPLWPLRRVTAAAYPTSDGVFGPAGLALALGAAVAGLSALLWASRTLNLARAAQETQLKSRARISAAGGFRGHAHELRQQARQGASRPPTRLPSPLALTGSASGPGSGALLWKALLQALRGPWLNAAGLGLGVAGLAAAWVLSTDLGLRVGFVLMLAALVSQHAPAPLMQGLSVHWLARQVPAPAWQLLWAHLSLPVAAATVAVWLGAGIASAGYSAVSGTVSGIGSGIGPNPIMALTLALLAPLGLAGAGLGGVVDMLRLNDSGRLLSGQLAPPGVLGVVLGALALGGPLGLWVWLGGAPGLGLGLVAGLAIDLALTLAAVVLYKRL